MQSGVGNIANAVLGALGRGIFRCTLCCVRCCLCSGGGFGCACAARGGNGIFCSLADGESDDRYEECERKQDRHGNTNAFVEFLFFLVHVHICNSFLPYGYVKLPIFSPLLKSLYRKNQKVKKYMTIIFDNYCI